MCDAIGRRQDYEPSNIIFRARLHISSWGSTEFSLPTGAALLVRLSVCNLLCACCGLGEHGVEHPERQRESGSDSLELGPRTSHSTQYMRDKAERHKRFQQL